MDSRLADMLKAAGLPAADPRALNIRRMKLLDALMTHALDVRDDDLAAAINEELEALAGLPNSSRRTTSNHP
jgi:hypothetical protein